MSDTADRAPSRGKFGCGALLAIALGSGLATLVYHRVQGPLKVEPQTQTVVRDTPNVVTSIRDLAALESTSYHIERVVDLRDRQTRMFGLVEAEDALLLVAVGDVVAGVDLTSMRDGDIQVDPVRRSARVLLPPVSVLSSKLDSQRTYLHSRKTDALAERSDSLETRARMEAENTLRDAALSAGILERAQKNTKSTLETLLRSLDYKQIEIRFRAE